MTYEYTDERLTLTANEIEREVLRAARDESPDTFGSTSSECEVLEPVLCNSELVWIEPIDTGDLTDAPMLGVRGPEQREATGPYGATEVGHWDGADWYEPILHRWAFMDYAVRSFLDDLIDTGEAVFTA